MTFCHGIQLDVYVSSTVTDALQRSIAQKVKVPCYQSSRRQIVDICDPTEYYS